MADQASGPYRPRHALPADVDDFDQTTDEDLGPDEDSPASRHGSPTTPVTPAASADPAPALPGSGYQPRHSAATASSGPGAAARPAGTEHQVAEPPPTPSAAPVTVVPPRRRALILGAVTAAVIVLLAVVYSVWTLGGEPTTAGIPGPGVPSTASATPSASPSADKGALPVRMMMAPAQARSVAEARWKVASDTAGLTDDSLTATCLAATDGEPSPEATRVRTLSSGGGRSPSVFHQADLYATSADAIKAMAVRTGALGDCRTPFALLRGGAVATNLGNQALGVTVLIQDTPASYHAILVNRTGRLLNVVDAASADAPVAIWKLGAALGSVTNQQCSFAVGLCATDASIRETMPPVGGDTPGLLVAADVPRIGGSTGTWTPGEPTRRPAGTTSNCEATDFAAVAGSRSTLARTYILSDDPNFFGFDTVLLTMPDASAAERLARSVADKITSCPKRLLTASVSKPQPFTGTGVRQARITGSTFVVNQKIDGGKTTLRYRVGIGSVGNKVVYTFANPQARTDFTDAQWAAVNVRAGQRATQIA